jgi:hypothetical protein
MTESVMSAPSEWWRVHKKKIIRILAVMVIAFVLYLGYLLDYDHALIGYLRNQPRYQGLPVEYWKARIQSHERWAKDRPNRTGQGLLADLPELAGLILHPEPGFREGDPEQLWVLLQLMKDADPDVRRWAANYLGTIQSAPEEAIDALIAGLDDPMVRREAMLGLARCGPAAKKALPKIIREFEEWKRRHPPPGPELAISPAEAAQLAKRYQAKMMSPVQSPAGWALQSIDPQEARKRGIGLIVPP